MMSNPDPDNGTPFQSLSVSSHEVSIGEQETKEIDPAVSELAEDSTSETRDVLDRAAHIARSLNHQQLRMAHLLLALTLSEYALNRLRRRNLHEMSIRSACWQELAAMPTVVPYPNVAYLLLVSEDVKELFGMAATQVAVRDTETRHIGIDDILSVITESPLWERLEPYFSGAPKLDPAHVTLEMMQKFTADISTQLQSMQWTLEKVAKRSRTATHVSSMLLAVVLVVSCAVAASFLLSVLTDYLPVGRRVLSVMVVAVLSAAFIAWMFLSTLRAELSEYSKIGLYAAAFVLAYELWLLIAQIAASGG